MEIGERLAEERKRISLGVGALAEACGVTRDAQRKYERGDNLPGGAYLEAAARNKIDIQYVLTGFRAGEVPGVQEAAALYETSGPWVSNLLGSFGLSATDGLREPLRGVDVAAEGAPRVRNALASMVQAYANIALAKPVTHEQAAVARSVHVLDEALLRSVMLGVEDFLAAKRARMPADKKVELIVGVYAHFLKQKQTKASRANVLEFIRRVA